ERLDEGAGAAARGVAGQRGPRHLRAGERPGRGLVRGELAARARCRIVVERGSGRCVRDAGAVVRGVEAEELARAARVAGEVVRLDGARALGGGRRGGCEEQESDAGSHTTVLRARKTVNVSPLGTPLGHFVATKVNVVPAAVKSVPGRSRTTPT